MWWPRASGILRTCQAALSTRTEADQEAAMMTQIATMTGRLVVVSGLALALTISSPGKAEQAGKENYFVQHPGSAGGRTEIDAFDRYAPVDLSSVLVASGFTATDIIGAWEAPPSPERPGQPY